MIEYSEEGTMKKLIPLVILVFAVCATVSFAEKTGVLTVKVADFRNDKGVVSVVLYNNADAFPKKSDKAVKIVRSKIKDNKAEVVFDKIPFGVYAFAVLHDENENKKMDYSTFGMPQEGYAFSNNATGTLGPPSYDKAKFEIKAPKVTQEITLNY